MQTGNGRTAGLQGVHSWLLQARQAGQCQQHRRCKCAWLPGEAQMTQPGLRGPAHNP